MKAVYKHELRSYFTNITTYILGAFILLFAGIYTTIYNVMRAYANFEYAISGYSFIFMFTVPLLTMRVIAEERKQKTDQLLYSLPISMTSVVLGKFFSLFTVFLIPMAIVGIYPLILSFFGTINFAIAYSTWFSFLVLGAALIAMGVFISSVTESTAISAGLCFIAMIINYMLTTFASYIPNSPDISFLCFIGVACVIALIIYKMTDSYAIGLVSLAVLLGGLTIYYRMNKSDFVNLFPIVLKKVSLYQAFYQFPNGIFNVASLVYLISVAVFFLFVTEQSLEKRRWS